MLFHNGTFFECPGASWMVIEKGRIGAIGPEESVPEGPENGTDRVDLRGRFVLPGFVDAHVHLLGVGLTQLGWRLDLAGVSREGTLDRLAEAARERGDGAWVLGGGWDESRWADKRTLSRRDLDRLSRGVAIAAVRVDEHLVILNSEGLRRLRETLSAEACRDLVDPERGEVREEAAWRVVDSLEPDATTLARALSAAAALCHRHGITSVHAMTPRSRVPILLRAKGRDRLRVTVFHKVDSSEEVLSVRRDERFDEMWVRFGGVKAFADGSLGAGNAAVGEPYADGGTGKLNHSDDELRAILRASEDRGWTSAIHAIGDRAIEQVLKAHEAVGSSPALRHRIEHMELPTAGQIERAAALGLHISMQPNFSGNWSGPGSMYEAKLGRGRDEKSNPLRRVLDAGAAVALGSDGMPVSALYGLDCAVGAPHRDQRVSMSEALVAYTQGGARLGFHENEIGRLEVGALADFVVLDEDPRVAPNCVGERRVSATYVGGERVFEAEEA